MSDTLTADERKRDTAHGSPVTGSGAGIGSDADTGGGAATGASGPAPGRARPAKGAGDFLGVSVVLAIVLAALGVLAVRDALVLGGAVSGDPLLEPAAAALDGGRPAGWLVWVGAALAVVGVWLVVTALRPRPVRWAALGTSTAAYVSPDAAAAMARRAAEGVFDVEDVEVRVDRRVRTVKVVAAGPREREEEVREEVVRRLDGLRPATRVTVRLHPVVTS